ncbi:MAG: hypothetical protein KAH95_18310, partial [Spirochaetales bacterium]|nr:hypothetical protein [Spirochaetales bacterium]
SIQIFWYQATDKVINSERLSYTVFYSTQNFSTVIEDIEQSCTVFLDWTIDITSCEILGLAPETDYYFYVIVRDIGENKAVYTSPKITTAGDSDAPLPGNQGSITITDLEEESLTVNWTVALDDITPQDSLEYMLVYSLSDNISNRAEAEANGIATPEGWILNTTSLSVTNLIDYSIYYFNVLVRDNDDNRNAYDDVFAQTVKIPRFYYTEGNIRNISRAELDGTGSETVFSTSPDYPCSITLDRINDKIYWGTTDGKIFRTNFDGTGNQELISGEGNNIRDIVLDISGDQLYWTTGGKLRKSALDGSSKEDIQPLIWGGSGSYDPVTPWGIDIDPISNELYWTDYRDAELWAETRGMDMTNNWSWVVTNGLAQESRDIVVNTDTGKIYWTDSNYSGDGNIYVHTLPGGADPTVITLAGITLTDPTGIDIDQDGEKIYWTDMGSAEIFSADLSGSNANMILSTGAFPWDLALDL